MEVMKLLFIVLLLAGGVFTFLLSILAFANVEFLKIKEGKYIDSGINLISTSAVSSIHKNSYFGGYFSFFILPAIKS